MVLSLALCVPILASPGVYLANGWGEHEHACSDMLDTMTIALQCEHYAPGTRAGFVHGCHAFKAIYHLQQLYNIPLSLHVMCSSFECLMLHAIVLISTDGGKFLNSSNIKAAI